MRKSENVLVGVLLVLAAVGVFLDWPLLLRFLQHLFLFG